MLSTSESLIENLREGVNTSQMTFLPRYLNTLSFILKLFFSGKCFAPPHIANRTHVFSRYQLGNFLLACLGILLQHVLFDKYL